MNDIFKKIPSEFPLTERPYKDIADALGTTENELIETLKELRARGVIRRVGVVLEHRRAGYTQNAMVIWKVAHDDVEHTGKIMASFEAVSHCYERGTGGYWEYNMYTMIHGKQREDCLKTVQDISAATGVKDFKMFFTKREFKKTSFSYGS